MSYQKRIILGLFVGSIALVSYCTVFAQTQLESLNDSASYAVGINFTLAQLKPAMDQANAQGAEFDMELLVAAIHDIMVEDQMLLNQEQAQQILVRWQEGMMHKQQELTAAQLQENTKQAIAFFAENKGKPGVQSTASGMQYIVIEPGSGTSPGLNDTVVVKYKGRLLNGTLFDETPPGETITFVPSGLIKGWQEALQMMKPGGKWKLFLPSNLAYGEQGSPPSIPPGAALIFELELVEVK